MTKDRFQRLQEVAKSKGKLLLVESVDITNTNYNLLENIQIAKDDKPILFEDTRNINMPQITARGVLKNVPVTKFTENKNGRIYSKKLWEAIANRKSFEGGSCLADHAEKEGSTTRICGTWHNFRVLENHAVADLYLIGEHGQLFLEAILSRNKNLGLSTVGFGDFLYDGKTVNPDSYELSEESVCDWVLTPSQGVFASYENYTETDNNKNYSENINTKNNTTNKIEEHKMSNTKSNIKENSNMDNELIKLQEFNVKSHIKSVVKESKKALESKNVDLLNENKENLISLLQNIPSSFVEERTNIENQISLIESNIIDLVKDKDAQLKVTSSSLKETISKHSQVLNEKTLMEKKLSEAKAVVEKMKEHMKKEEVEFTNSLGIAKNDVLLLEKEVSKRDNSIKLYEKSYNAMKNDISIFAVREKQVLSKLKTYSSALKKIKESISKVTSKDSKEVIELKAYVNEAKKLIKVYKEKSYDVSSKLVTLQKKFMEAVKEKNELKEQIVKKDKAIASKITFLENENFKLKKKIKLLQESYEDYAGKMDDGYLAPEPSEELKYELDKRKGDRYLEVTESIKRLYEKKVRQYPSIKQIESKIFKAKSVSEAVDMIDYYLSNSSISQPSRMKESFKDNVSLSNSDYFPAGNFLDNRY